jgi:hypothetical protein
MLEKFAFSQLQVEEAVFQQDGALPDFIHHVIFSFFIEITYITQNFKTQSECSQCCFHWKHCKRNLSCMQFDMNFVCRRNYDYGGLVWNKITLS